MTAAELHGAARLIPGAFEANAPPHRPNRRPSAPPLVQPPYEPVQPSTWAYVVAAPHTPTTNAGFALSILGDVGLCIALIYAFALAPGLLVKGITEGGALILNTFTRP